MNLQRYVVIAVFSLLLAAVAAVVFNGGKNTVQAARQIVEAYCRNEFAGDEPHTRERLVKFSPALEAQFQDNEHPWIAKHVNVHQQVVVSAYEVKDVRVDGDRATAVVTYRRLARTEERFRDPFIPDKKDNDLVTLNLVFDFDQEKWWVFDIFGQKQWWVLDPPPPRTSKQPLLEYYEWKVRDYSSMWEQELNDPTYDEEQKANVRARRDLTTGNLRILKSLP